MMDDGYTSNLPCDRRVDDIVAVVPRSSETSLSAHKPPVSPASEPKQPQQQ